MPDSKSSKTRKKLCNMLKRSCKGHVQHVVDIDKDMLDFLDGITRLENTNEGRRASDVGSMQQDSTNTLCCGGVAAGIQKDRNSPPCTLSAEVRNLQEWCARLSAEVENE